MAGKNILEATDDGFVQDVEGHKGLVVVDFWAAWCGPCQVIAPSIEQIAEDYNGKVKVAKLDVDAHPQTPMRFNVRSIPSVLFFKNGAHVDTVVGAVPKAYLVEKVEHHLG